MEGYLDGEVLVAYDLGAILNFDPTPEALPYIVLAHEDIGLSDYSDFSEKYNEVDIKFRQTGEWEYEKTVEEIREQIGKTFENASAERTRELSREALGIDDPSTTLAARARNKFVEWVLDIPVGVENPELMDYEVKNGFRILDGAGAQLVGITDEPDFIAEPIVEDVIGLNQPVLESTAYVVGDNGRFTGEHRPVGDKGNVLQRYVEGEDYRFSYDLGDSPRDQPMAEHTDTSFAAPGDSVEEEMRRWAEERDDVIWVDGESYTLSDAVDDIFEEIVGRYGPSQASSFNCAVQAS